MIRRPVWSGAGAADRIHREWVGLEVPMRSFSVLYWPHSKCKLEMSLFPDFPLALADDVILNDLNPAPFTAAMSKRKEIIGFIQLFFY